MQVPKRRGRPPGAKNKPKAAVPRSGTPERTIIDLAPAFSNAAASDLLEDYRRSAEHLRKAQERATDPKEVASITTTLNRTYWHIGQLTGAATITESKILRSDAWKNVLTRIEQTLAPFPEASNALAALFESLATV